jgi:hypothetical protein
VPVRTEIGRDQRRGLVGGPWASPALQHPLHAQEARAHSYPFNRTDHHVARLFPRVPDGTTVQKFNEATQSCDASTYDGLMHAWTDATMTFAPCEGLIFKTTAAAGCICLSWERCQ